MKTQIAYFLACFVCLACQSPTPKKEKIKALPTTQEPQKEKEAKAELQPIAEVWNIIKQKAKLPFTNEWKVPPQYNPALTCAKMTPQEFELLGLGGLYAKDSETLLPTNFFHSHKVVHDLMMLVIAVDKMTYTYGFELLVYDKTGKLIDHITLAFYGGDGGMGWEGRAHFLSDSVFETICDSSYVSSRKFPNIYHQSTQNITLSEAGKFLKSEPKYLIKKPQKEWLEKGRKNLERLTKGDTL
jgi:hypothetical protein